MSDIVDIFKLYSSEIPNKFLTANEERNYAKKYKEEQDVEAFHILITHNLKLVRSIAYRFAKKGYDLQDLVQAGNFGLMAAIERFDYAKGYRLSTYAVWWIRQFMQKYINSESYNIKVPVYLIDKNRHLHKDIEDFIAVNYREPSSYEIFQMMGEKNQSVAIARQVLMGTVSLDINIIDGDSGGNVLLSDMLSSGDDVEKNGIDTLLLENIDNIKRKALTDREYAIISMRYCSDPKTFEEIGVELGLSKTRIQQIEVKALRKMRYDPDILAIWKEFRP